MTEAEKIKRMVEWMGGWPEHQTICKACSKQYGAWNPFERIEDAFLPLEKIPHDEITLKRDMGRPEWECWILPKDAGAYIHDTGSTPARAIAEAAWQVIEQLTKEKKLNNKWAREALME